MLEVERSLASHMDEDSACTPGRISLKLVEQAPVVVKVFYTSGEGDQYGATL